MTCISPYHSLEQEIRRTDVQNKDRYVVQSLGGGATSNLNVLEKNKTIHHHYADGVAVQPAGSIVLKIINTLCLVVIAACVVYRGW